MEKEKAMSDDGDMPQPAGSSGESDYGDCGGSSDDPSDDDDGHKKRNKDGVLIIRPPRVYSFPYPTFRCLPASSSASLGGGREWVRRSRRKE
eukprot:8114368-Pyramimonas_sp.AAC.1